ncbi:hypothetical protein JRQ81_002398 [Phrynocephalus forsythii]|uniref:Cyclin-J-like protein n=1 Tax=Phrynocephalus forsythii TaxID=171643 RepID=A0A9Q0XIK0_9SAUR|nr:hypothetical protein JRQ81_002398 [Phrynocephalus forsythii]
MGEPCWKERLAVNSHQALREMERKLPVFKACSPHIGMRHYFVDLMDLFNQRYPLCPAARHLGIYLLDLCMDHFVIDVKELYAIFITCLLLACKFEELGVRVPKLEHLNNFAALCGVNLVLTKKDLLKMELMLLECFDWNLWLPTPADFIDYYLLASVSESDLYSGCLVSSLAKAKDSMETYSHYFLEVSLQDHVFRSFRPSLVAAACVCASRFCLNISPCWTTELKLLTEYSWEHLAPCVDLMLIAHRKAETKAREGQEHVVILQVQERQLVESLTLPTNPTQVLFQQSSSYHPLAEHSYVASQFCAPIQDLCSAYRESLLAPRPATSTTPGDSDAQADLPPVLQPVSIQGPVTMEVALPAEPTRCLALVLGNSYFSENPSCTPDCFDV